MHECQMKVLNFSLLTRRPEHELVVGFYAKVGILINVSYLLGTYHLKQLVIFLRYNLPDKLNHRGIVKDSQVHY